GEGEDVWFEGFAGTVAPHLGGGEALGGREWVGVGGCDEPDRSVASEAVAEPGEGREESVAEADEVEDVDERPEDPGGKTHDLEAAEASDRARPSDRGERAPAPVAKA